MGQDSDIKYNATGISIGDFMGASMVSIAQAQTMMSKEQAKAFMETCFIQKDNVYEPIMLNMTLTRSYLSEGGELAQVQAGFNLPLLTLIPVNILGVDNVDLKFSFEVTSQFVEETHKKSKKDQKGNASTTNPETPETNDNLEASNRINLLGGVGEFRQQDESESTAKTDTRSKSTIQVHMQAKTLPLSQGMLSLIDIYTKSIMQLDQKKRPQEEKEVGDKG